MDILIQIFYAGLSVLLISIMLDAPKKSLFYNCITGSLGWLVYLLVKTPNNIVYATFISSSVIALFSHIFSRAFKIPTTVFLISALYFFVPGTSIYRAVYALIVNDSSLFSFYFSQSILIAGAIATAIFMVDSIFIINNRIRRGI